MATHHHGLSASGDAAIDAPHDDSPFASNWSRVRFWLVFVIKIALVLAIIGFGLQALHTLYIHNTNFELVPIFGLIIPVALLLSLYPVFLQRSFEHTKKARIRGDVWTDLVCLGYWTKLNYSADVNTVMTKDDELHGEGAFATLAARLRRHALDHRAHSDHAAHHTSHPAGIALCEFRKRFEENYGQSAFTGPLLFLTLLNLLGWLSVLMPNWLIGGQSVHPTAWDLRGFKAYIEEIPQNLSIVSAAFLGAYLFNAQGLCRRYVRSDFKPTAINQASLRIVTALILGFLLTILAMSTLIGPRALGRETSNLSGFARGDLLIGFFAGIFSTQILWAMWRIASGKWPKPKLLDKNWGAGRNIELTDLDGLDRWHVDRLDEAGINYVRGLATADFLELMISVRLPTETLVDWVDQAILRSHVQQEVWNRLLHSTPLRTASDLLDALEADPTCKQKMLRLFCAETKNVGKAKPDNSFLSNQEACSDALDLLQTALYHDPNIAYIRTFRRQLRRIVEHEGAFPQKWPIMCS